MNRRHFAKTLAALPFAALANTFASTCGLTCTSNPTALQIFLQGPFAVVINSGDWSIKAFTPRHNSEHFFSFNGSPCDTEDKYGFALQPGGLRPPTKAPCIENRFPSFCADNIEHQQSEADHFITIDLPAPQQIFVVSSGSKAIMGNGGCAAIPGDHILQYDITDAGKILMFGSEAGTLVKLKPLQVAGYPPTYTFEVGLPTLLGGGDSDPDGTHAVDFYNNALLPYFPALNGLSSANKIQKITNCKIPLPTSSATTPAIRFNNGRQLTSTLECKIGGLTVTSP